MDAAAIVQSYLDEVSAAVLSNDWETYRGGVYLPCHIVSHDVSKVVATEEDLRAGFEQFHSTLTGLHVTDYIRLVESALRLDRELITGSYVSHVLSRGQRVIPPYKSQMTLRLVGNRWRAASVTNPLANMQWPLVRLQLPPDEPPKGPLQ